MTDETIAALELAADAVMAYERAPVAERVKASFAIRAHIETLRNGGERAQIVALQDPSVVHVSMLRGVIAKLGMAEWAHTHCLTARDSWQDMTLREAADAIAAIAAGRMPADGNS